MTTKKVYTVTDLGGGDGGKGGVVHKLCALRRPHTVIKVGGAQGSHGVTTARGAKFNFSQFGCGTFNGAQTFISDRFVFSPVGIINEANALRYEQCVQDPLSLLAIDARALATTPFHGIASRLRELARKENPRGIVGVGVGEAYLDRELHPELAIYAKDLGSADLKRRLQLVRAQKHQELAAILEAGFMASDMDEVKHQIDLIRDDAFLNFAVEQFREVGKCVRVVGSRYLSRNVLGRDGVAVIESSHGILTDRFHGFHPHTSRLRTHPEITSWSLLTENGYDGEVVKLGVTRAYQIRHGAGPLVSDEPEMAKALLPDETSAPDRYRGMVRAGPLDMVALRYALRVCGGSQSFDALCVTWFDQPLRAGAWTICESYQHADDEEFFSPEGEILVRKGEGAMQLRHQGGLTKALATCRPNCTQFPLKEGSGKADAIKLCSDVLVERLGLPVRMMSFGPTENDKECF